MRGKWEVVRIWVLYLLLLSEFFQGCFSAFNLPRPPWKKQSNFGSSVVFPLFGNVYPKGYFPFPLLLFLNYLYLVIVCSVLLCYQLSCFSFKYCFVLLEPSFIRKQVCIHSILLGPNFMGFFVVSLQYLLKLLMGVNESSAKKKC